ncbi:MAG: UDP-N-acetylmuramate dehydrogenase [Myxococcaceae bacterium]|nr:UDP-N-acetylmuramate dehydrogenase [Myxococcaceae bacterium]
MPARSHPLSRDVTFDVPLAKWTSVRVGGSAEALVKPSHPDVLVQTLAIAKREGLAVSILGGGANTLVGDGGVPGVTLKLPSGGEEVDGDLITLSAGAPITRLVTLMKQQQRVGAEFLAGIPGTIGGATTMNAGTKNGECMRIVDGLELATADGIGWVKSLPFVYRHTAIPAGAVVTRVRFRLGQGDLKESQAKMEADLGYRKRTQPLDKPNFGSVFTNPPGDHAGRLIESVQLKGHRIGNAQISELHANWIVNLGGATARDVVALMELATTRVRDSSGVTLTPEVKRIGVFTP